jgi:hypothetical protein
MDNTFLGFLTPGMRQAIYAVVAVAAGALLAFGVVTEAQIDSIVQIIAVVIAALTSLMAALNTKK